MSSRPSRGAARLAAILDALPDALVLVNANGTVVNANAIALEAFEAPGTALVGRGLLDLLPEFDSRLIPGSMRRPDSMDERGRTKPKRMTARRTDGSEFPVEVTSANLEDSRRRLRRSRLHRRRAADARRTRPSGTVDTEAELARSQRQTEMILRAAAEGVVGTDTDGRVVLVNPAAAQILGLPRQRPRRAGTAHAGPALARRRRALPVRGVPARRHPALRAQAPGARAGPVGQERRPGPVDLTTAPVRDGDQLVGAVMTFTDRRPYDALAEEHAAELEQHAEEMEPRPSATEERAPRADRRLRRRRAARRGAPRAGAYAALADARGPLRGARRAREGRATTPWPRGTRSCSPCSAVAARPAGRAAPRARDARRRRRRAAVARGQPGPAPPGRRVRPDDHARRQRARLPAARLRRRQLSRRRSCSTRSSPRGVDGAVELIGPGRAQFAVHAPPIEAEVDPERLATALAHLVADVAGIDATGNAPRAGGPVGTSTRRSWSPPRSAVTSYGSRCAGPYAGGDPVHEPIVRGIVRRARRRAADA